MGVGVGAGAGGPDGVVADRFGVRRRLPLGALSTRPMTFVIGTDRRVIGVVHSGHSMNAHADAALRALGGVISRVSGPAGIKAGV
ncbi:hypothetical protein [Micromonospora sp. NPDC023814]|uniref:hypothetical protein n=1 Tax=Micromonospora sp. NPDC023814 TaxID=3154596 RepID=UPI003406441B